MQQLITRTNVDGFNQYYELYHDNGLDVNYLILYITYKKSIVSIKLPYSDTVIDLFLTNRFCYEHKRKNDTHNIGFYSKTHNSKSIQRIQNIFGCNGKLRPKTLEPLHFDLFEQFYCSNLANTENEQNNSINATQDTNIIFLTDNQKNNVTTLVSIATGCHYKSLSIINSITTTNSTKITVSRSLNKHQLSCILSYFKITKVDKLLYDIEINHGNNKVSIVLNSGSLGDITELSPDLRDNMHYKLNAYNKCITNKLSEYSQYLLETFYPTDNKVVTWMFYSIHNSRELWFAREDLHIKYPIQVDDIKSLNYENLYNLCLKLTGTENDANCIALRRTYNSSNHNIWKCCSLDADIERLIS